MLLNIIFPAPFAIIVADSPKVSAPLYVTGVTVLFASAPAPPLPVPLKVKDSEDSNVNPARSNVAPLETDTPDADVPNGE